MYDRLMQADVLINPITSKTPDLAKAGAVSSLFNQVAGSELQQVCILCLFLLRHFNI